MVGRRMQGNEKGGKEKIKGMEKKRREGKENYIEGKNENIMI